MADYAAYKAAIAAPWQRPGIIKALLGGGGTQQLGSLWRQAPFAGSAITTAAAPTKATTGAMVSFTNAGSAQLWLAEMEYMLASAAGSTPDYPCVALIYDRLSHQGGLSGTVATPQTTNLPTAALTRYTSGVGVLAALEIYTAVGATPTTATISYTNQAGTAGQVSQAVAFAGGGTLNAQGRFIPISLASGDSGVRAVASVTLALSTGTAGAFGVVLYRPLMMLPVGIPGSTNWKNNLLGGAAAIQEVLDDACLCFLFMAGPQAASANAMLMGQAKMIEV